MFNLMINTNIENGNELVNENENENEIQNTTGHSTRSTSRPMKIKSYSKNRVFSPKSYIEQCLYKDIVSTKKRRKVKNDDFRILRFDEYNDIVENNYNVSQLKKMCKHYKYKVSGNKSELVKRLYNNMRLSNYAVKIQSLFRKRIVNKLLTLKKAHLFKHAINDIDFLTLEPISKLSISQIVCVPSGEKNHVYCFDICSLHNLLKESFHDKKGHRKKNSKKTLLNPFNRQPFPPTLFNDLFYIVKYTKLLGYDIKLHINNEEYGESLKKQNEFKAIELFQVIDTFGFITDSKWIMNLNTYGLSKFMKELIDVWDYRAQISSETRHRIFPSELGYPFRIRRNIFNGDIETIRKSILKKIYKFVTSGIDQQSQSLAVFYVLGALTIVSKSAAENLPWLFESFSQL